MVYSTECWVVKKQHIHKMIVAEMRMLRWINEYTQDLKWGNPLKDRGGSYWWKDERVAWDSLVIFRCGWLMH